ncbi:MAG TPA: hypothetical protein VMC82_02115 [Thermoplasmata archaeon]|nr:hypothetical protein [Thermoplasmata archaeon]
MMFRETVFCGAPCARAEFLEMFETLDGMLDSPAEPMIVDLRALYARLARAFADLAHE